MGYIPPLHYSSYHHYISQQTGHIQRPFLFTKVDKVKLLHDDEQRSQFKKLIHHHQRLHDAKVEKNIDTSAHKIVSQITGIGRVINLVI